MPSDEYVRTRSLPLERPKFCQYVAEPCSYPMPEESDRPRIFFAYAGNPPVISDTIRRALEGLRTSHPDVDWISWEDLQPAGQILYCKICSTLRSCDVLVADVSTMNLNVMFEIGYALGLEMPVVPIRDGSLSRDEHIWRKLGLFDTIGQVRFSNSSDIVNGLGKVLETPVLRSSESAKSRSQPVYFLKAPIPVEGSISLQSALKKARINYRSLDAIETPRISLAEAQRQVSMSIGTIAHLLDSTRRTEAHNARCAVVSGMAMAQQKAVLMLQEEIEHFEQPLDYRDVLRTYTNSANVPGLARGFFEQVTEMLQVVEPASSTAPASALATLDLGDVAAENEILGLREYFLPTGQSIQAQQGHARLVIGRKGAGKTAIFYQVRSGVRRGHERLIIDLKPEGHQFTQLKETILPRLGDGLKEHTLVAFWQYLLTSEIARYALEQDRVVARREPLTLQRYDLLKDAYGPHDPGEELDFSQRLLYQVDRVTRRIGSLEPSEIGPRLTEIMYLGDNRALADAVAQYLRGKDAVWLLIDNLDKGWPIRGASDIDILLVRALLEATRKLQREFSREEVDFRCLVFLRTDIYEMIRNSTPDKGKDTAILLDWQDPAAFEHLISLRLRQSIAQDPGDFDSLWNKICAPLIDGQATFDYIVERTLMRPRDLLKFIRHCLDVALNRGHARIETDDILYAEKLYSADLLTDFSYEVADTRVEYSDLLWAFESAPSSLGLDEATDRVEQLINLSSAEAVEAIDFLVWLSFFGVVSRGSVERYSYQDRGDVRRLLFALHSGDGTLVIHPAFRAALDSV